jgi:protease II
MEAGSADPKFLDFLKAQNDYTRPVLEPLASPRDKLLARIEQLDNAVPEVNAPTVAGDYILFLRSDPGARSASLMVRDANGSLRTLLDPETFAGRDIHANNDYVVPDFDGTLVAAGVSLGGSEIITIRVILAEL